jgi:hypothetical protein
MVAGSRARCEIATAPVMSTLASTFAFLAAALGAAGLVGVARAREWEEGV